MSSSPRALLLTAFFVSLACERAPEAGPPAPPPATPVSDGRLAGAPPATPADAAGDDRGGGSEVPVPPPPMPFGVPECDTFVTKYLACVEVRVPADQQPRLMADLQENRAKWRQLATMSQAGVALSLACRTMEQRVKSDLTVDFGCEF